MKKNNRKKCESFIVTDTGEWVDSTILEEYKIAAKADVDADGSKQVHEEDWAYGDYILAPKYDPKKLIDVLDLNSYHRNCVDVVARDSSGLNYSFQPKEGGNEEIFDNPLVEEFLDNIKPSINTLLYLRMFDRRAIGYGAIEVIRENTSDSQVINLTHIPAHTLRRAADGYRVQQKIGTKTVWFVIYGGTYYGEQVDVHADTGEIYEYNTLPEKDKANELLWTQEYAPGTNYYGRPPIVGSLAAVAGDLSRARYNNSFFKNYGMPTFAVTITGDFADYEKDPEDEDYDPTKTLKYQINQQLQQVIRNPHSAMCITIPSEGEEGNVDINIQPLSVEQREADFRLFRTDNRDEVIHSHRVDPSRIGIYDSGNLNGTSAKQTDKSYTVSTIAPIKAENEYDINTLLKNEFDLTDWKFVLSDMDPKDFTRDIDVIEKLFNMASITPNQIIKLVGDKFGLSQVTDNAYLDEYYLNGVPLDQVWQQAAQNNTEYADSVLSALNDEIVGEATKYDETEESGEYGVDVQYSTKADTTFSDKIRRIITSRIKT